MQLEKNSFIAEVTTEKNISVATTVATVRISQLQLHMQLDKNSFISKITSGKNISVATTAAIAEYHSCN